jgi:aliphatic sulfonates family ABC transporter substrate-binding protein
MTPFHFNKPTRHTTVARMRTANHVRLEKVMNRRDFLKRTALFSAAALAPAPAFAQDAGVKEVRIGYQKTGVLLIAKGQGLLEKRFAPQGIAVKWVEFSFGPPLLEALNSGSLEYGYTGDTPPIFAQAARPDLLYVGAIPARGYGQGIIVTPESPIKSLDDLKGKTVGVAKASSAHNLLITALETAGLSLKDINVAYLAPADAAAAYARGAIDAWSIWDPYYAIAEQTRGARALPIDREATSQNSFFLGNRAFTQKHPAIIAAINEEVARATEWANANRDKAAEAFAEASGVSVAAQKLAVERAEYTFGPLTEKVLAQQQGVADRFHRLGLIPKPIAVRDIVWTKPAA